MKKILITFILLATSAFSMNLQTFLDPGSLKSQWLSKEFQSPDTCDFSIAGVSYKEAVIKGKAEAFRTKYGQFQRGTTISNYAGGNSFSSSYDTYLWNFNRLICRLSPQDYQALAVVMFFRINKNDWIKPETRKMSKDKKDRVKAITMLHMIDFVPLSDNTFYQFYVQAYRGISGSPYRESNLFAKAVFRGDLNGAIKILHSPKIQGYVDYLYKLGGRQ